MNLTKSPEDVSPDGSVSGETAVLRMKIGGMSCSFCVNTLKTATGRLPEGADGS